ncbi:hypothetical protein [Providencia rettgeri]|uniref:Uncharacterized protein n=1 Tax=Providencia rettgeri TaxID=587 RepID=A0A2X2DUS5_PRORE|nr:hypothetical protein PROVRETT_05398 [Providencia rettgeri DSM 1131]MCW4538687.1 hypothetical protein [Providencia rettgeri]URR22801.1 hypothetical protein L3Q80_21390 [Providencia rettgeri]CAB5643964.1 Uncharacterised protein [Providencia rettgeri]CAB5677103.1 Uncharacterised protein [Providencia rettgeri]
MGYSRKNLSINYNDKQCFPLSCTVKMLLRTLVLLLVAGCAYIAGIMTEIKLDPELDTEGRVKSSVEDFLAYPSAANYKNVQYYVLTKSEEGDETGYYCGEVFGFENELPHGYKRFIVRLHKNRAGKVMISIPFVEKTDDIIPAEQFESVWDRYCKRS